MKAPDNAPDLSAKPGLARFAAHAGDTETWIDAAGGNLKEAEKNHAVYSAAPDLLEALRECLKALNVAFEAEGDTFGVHHNDAVDALAMAKNAIAKAEGRP